MTKHEKIALIKQWLKDNYKSIWDDSVIYEAVDGFRRVSIYTNVSYMVGNMFSEEVRQEIYEEAGTQYRTSCCPDDILPDTPEYEGWVEETYPEIFEWYLVDERIKDILSHTEVVVEQDGFYFWGRQTTGMDNAEEIWNALIHDWCTETDDIELIKERIVRFITMWSKR